MLEGAEGCCKQSAPLDASDWARGRLLARYLTGIVGQTQAEQ